MPHRRVSICAEQKLRVRAEAFSQKEMSPASWAGLLGLISVQRASITSAVSACGTVDKREIPEGRGTSAARSEI